MMLHGTRTTLERLPGPVNGWPPTTSSAGTPIVAPTGRYNLRLMQLAGDADRERAADSLREHFVRGRLTVDELAERTGLALRARSRAEVRRALDGLPQLRAGAVAQTVTRAAALALFTGIWLLFSFVLFVVFALTVLIHGASGIELAGFLLVWLVPTYLLSRLWRRGLTRRLWNV